METTMYYTEVIMFEASRLGFLLISPFPAGSSVRSGSTWVARNLGFWTC